MHSPISLSCFHLMVTNSSSSTQPLCDNNQSSVLLEFKQSFLIGQHASDDPSAYPNAAAWKSEGDGRYCCSWDVGECDKDTGHVISLNLGSSCLYGSINFSSTFFRLGRLQGLDLSDNDFNYSMITSGVVQLLSLRSLHHPFSRCSGQIPLKLLLRTVQTGCPWSLTKSIEAPVTWPGFRYRGEKHFLVAIQAGCSIPGEWWFPLSIWCTFRLNHSCMSLENLNIFFLFPQYFVFRKILTKSIMQFHLNFFSNPLQTPNNRNKVVYVGIHNFSLNPWTQCTNISNISLCLQSYAGNMIGRWWQGTTLVWIWISITKRLGWFLFLVSSDLG